MAPGQMLYSMPHVSQNYRTVPLEVNTPIWMRGPGFASASFVIESAMDELAHKLGVDPIELRRRNEPSEGEAKNLPFSTRRLRECYTGGAREFGWDRRNPRPRSTRDGDWLVGLGMAAGVYDPGRFPTQARARLHADGTAVVEAAATDMGPGTYTSQTQVAADALGLTMRTVTFRLGDSRYPQTGPHGGSSTMATPKWPPWPAYLWARGWGSCRAGAGRSGCWPRCQPARRRSSAGTSLPTSGAKRRLSGPSSQRCAMSGSG